MVWKIHHIGHNLFMTISEKDVLSTIIKFQGEYSQAHFELVTTYLFDGQNSILKDLVQVLTLYIPIPL